MLDLMPVSQHLSGSSSGWLRLDSESPPGGWSCHLSEPLLVCKAQTECYSGGDEIKVPG